MTLASNIEASVVSGSVICGKMKLAGVVVSDGTNFTTIQSSRHIILPPRRRMMRLKFG